MLTRTFKKRPPIIGVGNLSILALRANCKDGPPYNGLRITIMFSLVKRASLGNLYS